MLRSPQKAAGEDSSVDSAMPWHQQLPQDYRNDCETRNSSNSSSSNMLSSSRIAANTNESNKVCSSISSVSHFASASPTAAASTASTRLPVQTTAEETSTTLLHPTQQEEISVSNLRKLYSSLLEELAPLHHELGTAKSDINASSFRWKNSGSITVDGTDVEGYDYSYTPDSYSGSAWRLSSRGIGSNSNLPSSKLLATFTDDNDSNLSPLSKKLTLGLAMKLKAANSNHYNGGGITGGDWSQDGIKRYHTGGVVATSSSSSSPTKSLTKRMEEERKGDECYEEKEGKRKLFDERFSIEEKFEEEAEEQEDENENDDDKMVDVNILTPVPSVDVEENYEHQKAEAADAELPPSSSLSSSFTESKTTTKMKKQTAATIMKSSSNNGSSSFSSTPPLSIFESLYRLNPTATSWHIRSAYAPTTKQEYYLQSLASAQRENNSPNNSNGSGSNVNNNSNRATSIMSGINMAQNSEIRVCHSLKRITEILCLSERRKGHRFLLLSKKSRKYPMIDAMVKDVEADEEFFYNYDDDDDDDDEELEVSEAVFAYFCEKNVLPMLIDSFLNRPSQLLISSVDNCEDDEGEEDDEWWSNDTKNDSSLSLLSSTSSLFSGVSWSASVKSQILQTIAMLLLNTTSPLSLAYLLSNNYMNELIMGMLPLSQWREVALDEMLPPFVTLLRGLVMKLRGEEGRGLVPLLLCQRSRSIERDGGKEEEDGDDEAGGESSETYLPLLYAAVQVFCYSPGSSLRDADGCLVRTTAMNAILNLCRITSQDVRVVFTGDGLSSEETLLLPVTTKSASSNLSSMLPSSSSSLAVSSYPNATIEQRILFPFICSNLKKCYHSCVRLMMTSISLDKSSNHNEEAKAEATQRHIDLASSLFAELQYWLGFVDDLLSCEIRMWNVRLVEWIMREVVVGTILLHWNRALSVIGSTNDSESNIGMTASKKDSLEHCTAKAEIRVSIVFLTQLFAMVSYRPFIRLAGAAVLHPFYPLAWCGNDYALFSNSTHGDKDFFQVTPTINAIVSSKEKDANVDNAATIGIGEEADAGAGLKDDEFVPSRHRASLLEMLAGDESIIASMLFGTILENDALDDMALEKLGVLPSPKDDFQVSQFEEALAIFLTKNSEPGQLTTSPRKYKRSTIGVEGNKKTNETLSLAVEFVSSLGMILMERIIFHTWTEDGEFLDLVPFEHYYKSSKFIQALASSLTYFASFTKQLAEDDSLEEYFQAEFKRRYVPTEANNHQPYENNIKMACSIQKYHPSNFIDDPDVLLQIPGPPPSTHSAEDKTTKCAIRLTLHLRSLLGCIEEFHSRFTSLKVPSPVTKKHWYGETEVLSFCAIEEADERLLSIGGVEKTRPLVVGAEIDLRGRKSFPCFLQNNEKRRGADKGVVLVLDPSEICIAKYKKGDINRCTILTAIPLSTIIASASTGEVLHVVSSMAQASKGAEDSVLKHGRLSLCFNSIAMSISVKELLDKYCTAQENRVQMDIMELLNSCLALGNKILTTSSQLASHRREAKEEETWTDFQQA